MRSPLPFPCVPDRPYKILLVQVGTLSFSHPPLVWRARFIYLFMGTGLARTGTNTEKELKQLAAPTGTRTHLPVCCVVHALRAGRGLPVGLLP